MKTLAKKVHHTELPKEALEAISERQRSYIDEFTFYVYQHPTAGKEYCAFYAGELLCVWQNGHWHSSMTGDFSSAYDAVFSHLHGT